MEKRGDVIALEARLQAEFLYQHKPSEIKDIVMDVVVNTFLFYEKYKPVADESAFRTEFNKLFEKFDFAWDGYTPQLQLKSSMAATSDFYRGVNPDKMKAFLEKFLDKK